MKQKVIIIILFILLIISGVTIFVLLNNNNKKNSTDDNIEENIKEESNDPTKPLNDKYWFFRSVGTMNVTKDEVANVTPTSINGTYRKNIIKVLEQAKEVNANYVEQNFDFTLNEDPKYLMPYYNIIPSLARDYNLKVYFRLMPTKVLMDKIVNSQTDEEFEANSTEYFNLIEKLMFKENKIVKDDDIFSTWTESDNEFTTKLGWETGTKRFKQYVKLASKFVKQMENKYNVNLIYTESICGGEARLRDEIDLDVAKYIDFISWDDYVGTTIENSSIENMKIESKAFVENVKYYSELYGLRIALGEWSTHWLTSKTKEEQSEYLTILTDDLNELSSSYFMGMEYFHFGLPSVVIDFSTASGYYSSPLFDKTGNFPAFNILKNVYANHAGN